MTVEDSAMTEEAAKEAWSLPSTFMRAPEPVTTFSIVISARLIFS